MLSALSKAAEDRLCQNTGSTPGRGQRARTELQEQPASSFQWETGNLLSPPSSEG